MSPAATRLCEAPAEPTSSAGASGAPEEAMVGEAVFQAFLGTLPTRPAEAEAPADKTPAPLRPKAAPARRLLGRIAHGVAMAVVGTALVCLVAVLLFRFLPYKAQFVRTGSMRPSFPVGSLVVYERVEAANLRVGDVISLVPPGRPDTVVTHRVVRVDTEPEGKILVTKGDSNVGVDLWRIPARGAGWSSVAAFPKLCYVVGYSRCVCASPGMYE